VRPFTHDDVSKGAADLSYIDVKNVFDVYYKCLKNMFFMFFLIF